MKSRIMIKNLRLGLLTLFLTMLSLNGYSQACIGNNVTVTLSNIVENGTHTSVDFDVNIANTGSTPLRLAAVQGGVILNAGFLPAGATGSFTLVDSPTAGAFPAFNVPAPTWIVASRQARWTHTPVTLASGSTVVLPTGTTLKFARFRFTSTLAFTSSFAGTVTLQVPVAGGFTNVLATVYCNGNASSTGLGSATAGTLSTPGNPYSITLNANTCPTTGASSNLVAVTPCANATNGSATITMSPTPTATTGTYTVDGGGSIATGTLTGGAFTISGLAAGNHSVVVTVTGCSAITVPTFTIGGTALTTNGSVTTNRRIMY